MAQEPKIQTKNDTTPINQSQSSNSAPIRGNLSYEISQDIGTAKCVAMAVNNLSWPQDAVQLESIHNYAVQCLIRYNETKLPGFYGIIKSCESTFKTNLFINVYRQINPNKRENYIAFILSQPGNNLEKYWPLLSTDEKASFLKKKLENLDNKLLLKLLKSGNNLEDPDQESISEPSKNGKAELILSIYEKFFIVKDGKPHWNCNEILTEFVDLTLMGVLNNQEKTSLVQNVAQSLTTNTTALPRYHIVYRLIEHNFIDNDSLLAVVRAVSQLSIHNQLPVKNNLLKTIPEGKFDELIVECIQKRKSYFKKPGNDTDEIIDFMLEITLWNRVDVLSQGQVYIKFYYMMNKLQSNPIDQVYFCFIFMKANIAKATTAVSGYLGQLSVSSNSLGIEKRGSKIASNFWQLGTQILKLHERRSEFVKNLLQQTDNNTIPLLILAIAKELILIDYKNYRDGNGTAPQNNPSTSSSSSSSSDKLSTNPYTFTSFLPSSSYYSARHGNLLNEFFTLYQKLQPSLHMQNHPNNMQ